MADTVTKMTPPQSLNMIMLNRLGTYQPVGFGGTCRNPKREVILQVIHSHAMQSFKSDSQFPEL